MAIKRAAMTVEREAKLVAPADLELPDLSGLVAGAITVSMPVRQLDAVYYDTADLRLARSGVTLRYRSGEQGTPWTVKLPQPRRGAALTRTEIGFDGPQEVIPEAAVDLLSAISRGRHLGPVCRLSTTRHPVQIFDSNGLLVAEVVDDTVSASSGRRRLREFREVEIEVYPNAPDNNRLLRKAIRRLTAAGCEALSPTPKLIRALGARAERPADVTTGALSAQVAIGELVEHAIARSVAQIIRHDPGVRLDDDPEDVHQLRVGARRLRSDLRTFIPLLDRHRVAKIRGDMEWLGKLAGFVRDADVLAIRLRQAVTFLPEQDRPAGESLLARLDGQRSAAREALLAAMRSRRYLRALDDLVDLAASPPFVADTTLSDQSPTRVAARLVRRPCKALALAVHALGDDPADTALHRVRILAKHCRYAAEAVTPLARPRFAPFAAAMADVQNLLGDYHDTVVAEAWLREAAKATPAVGVAAGELISLERLHRAELRNQWTELWGGAASRQVRRWL